MFTLVNYSSFGGFKAELQYKEKKDLSLAAAFPPHVLSGNWLNLQTKERQLPLHPAW
jgi:hypothetical protein